MPGTTISTTIDAAITLGSAGYVGPISITNTGAIEPMQFGATALTVPAGAADATLTNHGMIVGGNGLPPSRYGQYGTAGGDGVRAGAGAKIVNDGTILGGGSTTQNLYGFDGGGTGVDIYGAQGKLINNAIIDGGAGSAGGSGGIGVSVSSGAIAINNGIIAGGAGGNVSRVSGAGVVVQNASLVNNGTIEGGFTNLDIELEDPGSAGVVLSAGKVTNHGVIIGGAGVAQSGVYNVRYGAAGAGVLVTLAGSTLVNDATIHGGIGDFFAGVGGVGVAAYDASTVINNGLITGGWSGAVTKSYRGYTYTGFGGDGVVLRSGARLTNHGVIIGGTGGPHGSYGGTGAYLTNAYGSYPDMAEMTNQGLITGGKGGKGAGGGGAGIVVRASGSVSNEAVIQGGVGGAAGYNANSETYKVNGGEGGEGFLIKFGGSGTNSGAIIGGNGGAAGLSGLMGHGGIGLVLTGTGQFANKGVIRGGNGGAAQARYQIGYVAGGGYGAVVSGNAELVNMGIISAGNSDAPGSNGSAGVYERGGVRNAAETLINRGIIIGGAAGAAKLAYGQGGGTGGAGLVQSGAYALNTGTILGGAGRDAGSLGSYFAGNGGYGGIIRDDVGLPEYQATFKNSGTIIAGAGGSANSHNLSGGNGGTGLTLTSAFVVNIGVILGGAGGEGAYSGGQGGRGGLGVYVGAYGSLINRGLIEGGAGGYGVSRGIDGAIGVYVGAKAGSVSNTGSIIGGNSGVYGPSRLAGGFGGTGLSLNGGSFANGGKISGGSGGGLSGGGVGVYLTGNAVLTNAQDGSIQGGYFAGANRGASGVYIRGDGGFVNAGQIVGGAVKYQHNARLPDELGQGGAGVTLQYDSTGSNSGSITGGGAGSLGVNIQGVAGGTGLYMFTYITGYDPNKPNTTFFNSGHITGGDGGNGTKYGGDGGEGVYLSYGTLTNSGTITGGSGGTGKLRSGQNGDAVRLGVHATLIVENGAVFNGLVLAEGGTGNTADTLELSGTSSTPLTGIGTKFTGFHDIDFAANAAWTIAGDTAGLTTGQEIKGFTSSDAIELTDAAASSGQVSVGTAGIVTLSAGGDIYKLDIAGATVGETNFTFSDYTLRESVISPAPAMTFLRPAQPASASPSLFTAPGLDHFMTVPGFPASLRSGTESAAWANHPSITTALHIGALQDISRLRQGEVQTLVTLHA